MTQDQRDLLVKARQSLSAGKHLLAGGYPDFAASRAYFAMFYVAEAFLEGEGMSFSRHSAVIAAFGQHLAHTGKVPVEFHRTLIDAQEWRLAGDYDKVPSVSENRAQQALSEAENFVELGERLIT